MYQCSLAVGTYKEELVHNLEVATQIFREVPFDSSNDGAGDHLARAGNEEHQLAVCSERGSHRRQPRVQSSCSSYGHYNSSLHSVNTVLLLLYV